MNKHFIKIEDEAHEQAQLLVDTHEFKYEFKPDFIVFIAYAYSDAAGEFLKSLNVYENNGP
jgi:hypothetical protein